MRPYPWDFTDFVNKNKKKKEDLKKLLLYLQSYEAMLEDPNVNKYDMRDCMEDLKDVREDITMVQAAIYEDLDDRRTEITP